jgi:hypothetical protein
MRKLGKYLLLLIVFCGMSWGNYLLVSKFFPFYVEDFGVIEKVDFDTGGITADVSYDTPRFDMIYIVKFGYGSFGVPYRVWRGDRLKSITLKDLEKEFIGEKVRSGLICWGAKNERPFLMGAPWADLNEKRCVHYLYELVDIAIAVFIAFIVYFSIFVTMRSREKLGDRIERHVSKLNISKEDREEMEKVLLEDSELIELDKKIKKSFWSF